MNLSRRDFLGLLAMLAFSIRIAASTSDVFRIRTITAGLQLESITDIKQVEEAMAFLQQIRKNIESRGYEVQTLRLATQPLAEYLPDWIRSSAVDAIKTLDQLAMEQRMAFSIGPVITDNQHIPEFGEWAARVIQETGRISFTVSVASAEKDIHHKTIRSAAEAIASIARTTSGGEGNFRFAAAAFIPPGTPFFPAAYYEKRKTFSIGMESPRLLTEVFKDSTSFKQAKSHLKTRLETAFGPIEKLSNEVARKTGRQYLGIDVSPAPGLDASIGEAIETLTGQAFGSPSTLAACAAITDVLQGLNLKTCGYSGLMLPVLEDAVLARRAAEGRYGISELLLYSSVCGTGLDVVPLPGDVSVEALSSIIGDVAALATKYRKPLSARLFPVPGKKSGEMVQFDNPYLTDSVVMSLD